VRHCEECGVTLDSRNKFDLGFKALDRRKHNLMVEGDTRLYGGSCRTSFGAKQIIGERKARPMSAKRIGILLRPS
jgi:hypothetical protein